MSELSVYVGKPESQGVIPNEHVFCQHQNNQTVVQFGGISHLCKSHAKEIHKYLKEHVRGDKHVVIDLDGVVNVDAQGLALLIHLNKKLQDRRRELSLINPSSAVRRILSLTTIDKIIPIQAELDRKASELANSKETWREEVDSRPRILNEKKYK